MLFSYQRQKPFPDIFLYLISTFMTLWPENIFDTVSISVTLKIRKYLQKMWQRDYSNSTGSQSNSTVVRIFALYTVDSVKFLALYMAENFSFISIIFLNVNELNPPVKWHRELNGLRNKTHFSYLEETHLKFHNNNRHRIRDWGTIIV